MADLSKLELTDSTIVTIKDNSQVLSDHRHHESDLVPIVHKKYESTDYYATTSGSWETSTWYFASIKPDSWYLPWKAKFKIHTYCPVNAAYESLTYAMVTGRADSLAYCNWNELNTTAHYYTAWYPLKAAGFNNGYGHAFGISILYASNYTSSSYYRTFEIDFIECENCTVTILDTPVKYADWPGTGSTNYGSLASGNASSRGLQETGDNDTSTSNRIANFPGKTGAKGIWATSLFMEDANGTYENICTASDGTVTSSNRTVATTKKANTTGFKVLGTIYYTNTSYAANTNISGGAVIWTAYGLFDSRYAFNTELTATSLTPFKELYLVGTIHSDGLFYLDSTWWTQTPNDTSKIYVLVGACWDSSTSYCRITMYEQNKWYRYDGSQLIEIANDARSVNGHTVESDVPSGAVFTDTTYSFTGGTNKIVVTPSGGTASDVTFTASDDTRVLKAGDTMTGDLIAVRGTDSQRKIGFTNDSDKYGGLKLNNSGNNIDFGWDYDQVAGAGAYFRSAAYGSGVNQGQFGFYARSSAGTVQLVGTTGGALTWNNRKVVTATNNTQIGSATKPVYVNGSGYVTECTYTVEADVPSGAEFTDTKNTAGSTDTSSKIYLIGATSQAANPQTYSDDEVYATSGVVTTKSVQVGGGAATMQFNSTTNAIDFIFT